MIAALLANSLVRMVLIGVIALAMGYGWGRIDARQIGKVDQLKATVDALEKRKGIDADVTDTDRHGLCLAAGGLPDDCNELRRVDEAAKAK